MNEQILALIRKEKKEKTGILNLGRCGLKSLPDELFELIWLEELNLGNSRPSSRNDLYMIDPSFHNKVTQWSQIPTFYDARMDWENNDFEKADLGKLKVFKNLNYLDLANTYLNNYDFIFDLPNLRILNLTQNLKLGHSINYWVKKLKQGFTKLNLRALDISYTECSSAEWDWNLINKKCLEFLNIRGTRFGTWSELGMAEFSHLRAFDADHHIAYLEGYEAIGQLKNLEFLDLSWIDEPWQEEEKINYDFLGDLTKLKALLLIGLKKIKSFDFLDKLEHLEFLHLNKLSLKKLPSALSHIRTLKKLDLTENQLESCEGLSDLVNIRDLDLSYNRLNDISSLERLINIERLDLQKNNLKSTSAIKPLMSLPNLKILFLYGNPLEDIPTTFLGSDFFFNSLEPLRTYFKTISRGFIVNNEIKLVLTGNSTAGKTSFRKLLKEEPIDVQELTTHGIVCDTWRLSKKDLKAADGKKDIVVHIWDFGGQEYYHATHRLFFTSRSVYILIWEKATNKNEIAITQIHEEDEQGNSKTSLRNLEHFPYEYWLETIRQYDEEMEKSPVFMVQNKIELPGSKEHLDQKSLEDNYSNIDFFEISVWRAAQNETDYLPAYRKFKHELLKKLSQITLQKNIGRGLAEMREEIEEKKNINTWTYEEYVSRIKAHEPDISDRDIYLFTKYFRDEAGVILYYGNNEKLKDIVFLNPMWVIDCIYNVLDYSVSKNNGIFNREHVLAKNKSGLETEKLVELMKSFELIFEDGETADLIAPQFLPDECLNKKAISPYLRKFEHSNPSLTIYFPQFLPRTIMLRFLSKFGNEAVGQLYWKNGIAFSKQDRMVYVKCNNRERAIVIYIEDNDLELQTTIFCTIYRLCNKNAQLEVSLNGEKDFVKMGELVKQYSLQNRHIQSQQGNVMNMKKYEHLVSSENGNPFREIKVFVSYAHEDIGYMEEFRDTHLKSIQNHYASNLEVCTDGELRPGMDWDNKLKQFLQQATITVFLISPDFLASGYIKRVEIDAALKRFEEKKQIIIPVLIRPCSKKLLPFKNKQYLPGGMKALKLWPNKDVAWENIVDGIIKVVDDINDGKWEDYFD